MRVLNVSDVQQVSGGDSTLVLTINVPDAETKVLVELLGDLLTDQLTATKLADMMASNVAGFNDMPIQSIKINQFTITAS